MILLVAEHALEEAHRLWALDTKGMGGNGSVSADGATALDSLPGRYMQ